MFLLYIMSKNYYDILGVNKDASQDEIKKILENYHSSTTLTAGAMLRNLKSLEKLMKLSLI